MAVPVIMPRQGQSVESCLIAKWFKKKGDLVNIGDPLFSYETDKAAFDEDSKVSGTILEIFAQEGDDVPVLTPVCVIGSPGEDFSDLNTQITPIQTPAQSLTEIKPEITAPPVKTNQNASQDLDMKISPRAKKLAEKTDIDFRTAEGTGPYGRIIEKDIHTLQNQGHLVTSAAKDFLGNTIVSGTGIGGRITTTDLVFTEKASASETVAQANEPTPEYRVEKISNIRKVIAKAMLHSITTTCQLTMNASFDATEVLDYRKKIKEGKERLQLENITLNDIIVYTVSRVLHNHPDLNAHFLDDTMHYFKNAHIGIAIDTERGLMVPTIFNANLKSLNQISAEIKQLVNNCQKGTINPDMLKGASFTITNLGTLDIESFTPVINPPQTGILGVNNISQKIKENAGEYAYYPAMGLSLTFDHRALDGAPAAKFFKELKTNLENFSVLLAKQ